MKEGMKDVIYWSVYVLIVLGIIIWSLVSLFSCSEPPSEKLEELEIDHVNLDSLHLIADSVVDEVHHTIDDLDEEVRVKEKKIKTQMLELKRMQNLYDLKKQEALAEIKKSEFEKSKVNLAMKELSEEFERKWDAYDTELFFLEKEIELIVKELNTAVEEIVVVVLELGQKEMLYDPNTQICKLVKHLPLGRLDSLIANTPELGKRKLKQKL